jgi:hypothetical protein
MNIFAALALSIFAPPMLIVGGFMTAGFAVIQLCTWSGIAACTWTVTTIADGEE